MPITKKEYFSNINSVEKDKYFSKLLVLNDSLKGITKGFDAIVLWVPKKKAKKLNPETTMNLATKFGYRGLNYPENLDKVGNDTEEALNKEEVVFFNTIYQHEEKAFDFAGKRIVVVDFYSKKTIPKNQYINRIKKHLENDFRFHTDDLIILTEDEKKETGGIDAVILLPEKMYIRKELIEIVKKNII